jgi:hypothetical protein
MSVVDLDRGRNDRIYQVRRRVIMHMASHATRRRLGRCARIAMTMGSLCHVETCYRLIFYEKALTSRQTKSSLL